MKALIVAAALLLLAGCRTIAPAPPLAPPVLDVDPLCWQACDVSVPVWAPADPADPAAWDTYPIEVTVPLKVRLDRCSAVHHRACQQALRRGATLGLYALPGDAR